MKEFDKELEAAKKAAMDAGKILMSHFCKTLEVRAKKKHDYITNVDLEAEATLINTLTKEFPDYSIVSEERGEIKKKSDFVWYVDPLDGTINYIHNVHMFGVCIALTCKNEVVLGIIYLPYTGQMLHAVKGKGAYINNEKANVSDISKIDESFIILSEGFRKDPYSFKNIKNILKTCIYRTFGACSVGCAYTALGTADAFIIIGSTPWDIAAPSLIIEEAGGKITDLEGKPYDIFSRNIIVSNGKLHDEIINRLNNRR